MLYHRPPGQNFLFLLFSLMVMYGCKKNNTPGGGTTGPPGTIVSGQPPAVTPIGLPVGSPVTKTIGPAGGQLVSTNGVLELNIPPGALQANTVISIQTVINTMPGALDTLSYDLLPNGTKFNVPATITFHYTTDQVIDNRAEFLFIAYQDNSQAWVPDIKQRDYDTTAKTVSLDISHFTIFTMGLAFDVIEPFQLHGNPLSLKPYETSILTLRETYTEDKDGNAHIVQDNVVDGKYLSKWAVNGIENGNSIIGTVTPAGSQASYLAPAVITQVSIVNVSVHINISLDIYKKGKKVATLDGFDKLVHITLEPYHTYTLTVVYAIEDSTVSGFYDPSKSDPLLPVYRDIVLMHIELQAKPHHPLATLIDMPTNDPPTVTPGTYKGPVTSYGWVPDPYGRINITNIVSDDLDDFPQDSIIRFYTTSKTTFLPGLKFTSNVDNSVVQYAPPQSFPGEPDTFDIDFKVNASANSNVDHFHFRHDEGGGGFWTHLTVLGH